MTNLRNMYRKSFNFKICQSEQEIIDFINEKDKRRDAVSVIHSPNGWAVFYYERIMYYEEPTVYDDRIPWYE